MAVRKNRTAVLANGPYKNIIPASGSFNKISIEAIRWNGLQKPGRNTFLRYVATTADYACRLINP